MRNRIPRIPVSISSRCRRSFRFPVRTLPDELLRIFLGMARMFFDSTLKSIPGVPVRMFRLVATSGACSLFGILPAMRFVSEHIVHMRCYFAATLEFASIRRHFSRHISVPFPLIFLPCVTQELVVHCPLTSALTIRERGDHALADKSTESALNGSV